LKESVAILEEAQNKYKFIFTSSRKTKTFEVDNLVKDILSNTSETKPIESLYKKLMNQYSIENITSAIKSLEKEGILRIQTSEISERHKKQIYFIDELTKNWAETINLHEKLISTKVAIFGLGGIGSWMINGIYQLGIEDITIIDPDVVEKSNLNRQLGYFPSDVGKYKVDVWKERLKLNSLKTKKMFIDKKSDLSNIIKDRNLIINCADKPSVQETTKIIDKYATKFKIPYCVSGGYNLHLGMIGPIIVPGKTKTFEKFMTYQKNNNPLENMVKIKDVEESGNLGPIAGTVANMQLMEIFKHIIGKGNINYNKFAEFDSLEVKLDWRDFS
jgi:molybdopterin/thiamine biosynthesis adenylyltransferase